jgi:predicted tellurium resistance membrane protein TerC
MIANLIDYLSDRLPLVTKVCYVALAFIVFWSMSVDTSHAHTWAEKTIPGFWSLFGIASCAIVIMVARWYGKSGIQTREDYYDN